MKGGGGAEAVAYCVTPCVGERGKRGGVGGGGIRGKVGSWRGTGYLRQLLIV